MVNRTYFASHQRYYKSQDVDNLEYFGKHGHAGPCWTQASVQQGKCTLILWSNFMIICCRTIKLVSPF